MRRTLTLPGALAAAALAAGCAASASPRWDAQFGDSVRILQAQQVDDFGAPTRNAQAVPRTDGRTVRAALDHQAEATHNPPASTVVDAGGSR
jgi:hypothetical protein